MAVGADARAQYGAELQAQMHADTKRKADAKAPRWAAIHSISNSKTTTKYHTG